MAEIKEVESMPVTELLKEDEPVSKDAPPVKEDAEMSEKEANEERVESTRPKNPTIVVIGETYQKVTTPKINPLTEEQLVEALKDVEDFESDADNNKTMKELGDELLRKHPRKNSKLTIEEMNEEFSSKHFFNPEHVSLTIDEKNEDYKNYLLIRKSLTSKTLFLSGKVSAVFNEHTKSGRMIPCCDIYMGSYTVRIPVTEFMWIDGLQKKGEAPAPMSMTLASYCEARIGSTCEFRITSFDAKKKLAYGTRIEPLGVVGFANYVKKIKGQKKARITEGLLVPATVVATSSSFVICEAFGAEFIIRDDELQWGGCTDVDKNYSVGDRFKVVIKSIVPEVVPMGKDLQGKDRFVKKINVIASKREATENPYEKLKDRYEVGTVTSAEVTSISRQFGCRCSLISPSGTISKVFFDFPSHLTVDGIPRVGDIVKVVVKRRNDENQLINVSFKKIITRKEDRYR